MTSVVFQSNLRKRIRKFPKILKFVKINNQIIQYYSIIFNRVLRRHGAADPGAAAARPAGARERGQLRDHGPGLGRRAPAARWI